ncbi:MAG: SBBP repeat-containing protein, partial [Ignavibacteriales bacterium]|nr:SBBP repeat-containing protein [Ignavibacteriales bacterium]
MKTEKHSPFRLRQIELLSNGNKDAEINLIHRKSKTSHYPNTVLYQNKNFQKEGIYEESIYPTESEDKLVGAKRTTNKKNIDTRISYGNDNKKILEGDVHEEWVQRYASNSLPSDDYSNAIAVDNIGNVYITGVSFTSYSGADYFTIKFNQRGDTLWSHRFNGSGNDYDEATAIALDRNGNVYVTGYSYGGTTGYDYVTIKYTNDGIIEWIRDYNSQDDSTDVATCLGIDSLDNVFISGYCYSRETDFDIFTIKYNSKGNIQWTQKYNGSDNNTEGTFSIFVNPDGQIFIAGYSNGEYSGLDCITLCYSPEGDLNWSDRYSSPGSGTDVATSVAADGGGNCYTTGFSA